LLFIPTSQLSQNYKKKNPPFVSSNNTKINFNDAFEKIGHIFIDFSICDMYQDNEDFPIEVSLGIRLASHFFFGVKLSNLKKKIGINQRELFSFENVVSLIGKLYGQSGKKVLLTVQLDEFQKIPTENLILMLNCFASYMISNLPICFLVQLSGTDTDLGIKSISASSLVPTPLLVLPLLKGEDLQISKSRLENSEYKDLLENPIYLQTLESLGGVPRFLQVFFAQLNSQISIHKDIKILLSNVLDKVANQIQGLYPHGIWEEVLGRSQHGVRQMVLWALSGKEVELDDKLNGIIIREG